MRTKTILIVHGDKGGVGKTTYASLAIDYLLNKYGAATVIEGDKKIADVLARYVGVSGVKGLTVDLARPDLSEEAIIGLFAKIEEIGGDHIVINCPASASGTIDAQAEIIMPAAQELGYQVIVAWLMGPGEDSARLAIESALCREADQKIAVINGLFGDPERTAWAKHESRADWQESGGYEGVLPAMTDRIARRVRETPGRFTAIANDRDLTVIERQAIKRWIEKSWSQTVEILYTDEREAV